jgi:deoxyhypusine synthase
VIPAAGGSESLPRPSRIAPDALGFRRRNRQFFIDFLNILNEITAVPFLNGWHPAKGEAMQHKKNECDGKEKYLKGKRVLPKPISKKTGIVDLIDNMDAYNGGRLRAACQLLKEKYSKSDVTVGLSLAGAMTPAGIGPSAIIPLMNHGFIDWMVATGANMYHDLHFAFNLPVFRGSHNVDDADLRQKGVTRIYDILFDYEDVLMETDRRLRRILIRPEFQKEMGTREFYHLLGKVMDEWERKNRTGQVSVIAAAYRNDIPIFTSSPGDSTIGMNVAGIELLAQAAGLDDRFRLKINPSIDVNDSTAIILNAKRTEKGKTAVILIGGGSPKNFMLQTEPQIQEVLMIPEVGQDYDINITDARPDTGGLSGASPSEAVSWGKIDPDKLSESVTAYLDNTVALPLLTAYVLQSTRPKKLKRLYRRGPELNKGLIRAYLENNREVEELKRLIGKLPE